ncbi:MAG TPA: sialate O-acetylesterase [Marinilabiliales bacterium]|nr:sialate O-acetylesterase [Marinilabiliales bacterium]
MKFKLRILGLIFILALFFHQECQAQVSLPKVFGDNMVLQRELEIPVWGISTPGANIIAELGNTKSTAKADPEGKWTVHLPKFKAGGPYTLKIYEEAKPSEGVVLNGILIGDVWLASGQSNMEWQVQQAKDASVEIANANFPQVRFLIVDHSNEIKPQTDISTSGWKVCDSISVKELSAVAYIFSRKNHVDQKVPIGIVQSTWGGTRIEPWTSREMLLTSPITREWTLSADTLHYNRDDIVRDSLKQVRFWDIVYNPQNNAEKIFTAPDYDDSGWTEIAMPNVLKNFGIGYYEGMVWMRKKLSLPESYSGKDLTINLGHPEMTYSLYFNGNEICKNVWFGNATHSYTIPATLVQSGENTIAVRIAMLWGGGGLNPANDIYITDGSMEITLAGKWLYEKDLEPLIPKMSGNQGYPTVLFNSMINPLIPYGIKGFLWYQGESNAEEAYNYRELFPMLIKDWRKHWQQGNLPFLYVQLANYMERKPLPSESEWAELREAQTMALSLPNTGMACTIDIGDAGSVHPLNKQEVGRRLALIANKTVYKQDGIISSGPMYRSYRKEGNRIRIRFSSIGSGLSTSDGEEVKGFAIAGEDKQFHWAKAVIEGNELVVYCDEVENPEAVRYAWADNPECNLVNSEGLPAVPFRTDDWKGITQK